MTALAPYLRAFLLEHLPRERNASLHTIETYAYSFKLLVCFAATKLHVKPCQVEIEQLDVPLVLTFLQHIESDRGNSARTRNARLAAIHSFFRFLEYRLVSCLDQACQIHAIPMKKADEALVGYLSRDELLALLDAPDTRTISGVRDRAMLHVAFAAGLRVSELVSLRLDQLDQQTLATIHVMGKGRRERVLPLWKETAVTIKKWLAVRRDGDPELFHNAAGRAMTRSGFEYILTKHVATAAQKQPSIKTKRVTPHVLRHTCALQTLQATKDIRKVSLWLGHASLQSTEIYLRADPTAKLDALAVTPPPMLKPGRFQAPDKLLAMLQQAGRSKKYVE
jgi:integrase/recombinase XerD